MPPIFLENPDLVAVARTTTTLQIAQLVERGIVAHMSYIRKSPQVTGSNPVLEKPKGTLVS